MNGDIWKVIEAVTQNFEKRTGLTELVYGESASSYRSAEEAQLKGSQLQIRPDDMAQKVEDAMTCVARKEALAARWHLSGQDVQGCMGPIAAHFWDQVVATHDFFVGDRYTIADIAIYGYSHLAHEAGIDMQPHANLNAWFERVAQQPGHIDDVEPYGANAAQGAGRSLYG